MDNIKLIRIDHHNISSYKLRLLQSFNFHPSLERKQREYDFLKEIIKSIGKERSIMYLLAKDNLFLGCVSLSASNVNDTPSSQIDYLFVDYSYRKEIFKELNNRLLSRYLVLLAIRISEKVRQDIAMKYLVLYPDRQSQKLVEHYKNDFGFSSLNKEWLFIKLD